MSEAHTISFELADYQRELVTSVRKFATSRIPMGRTRQLMTGTPNFDPDVYRQLARQLGVTGLRLPEQAGGADAGFVEVSLVARELGRRCDSGPYWSTAAAIEWLLVAEADDVLAEWGPDLTAGTRTATAVWGTGDSAAVDERPVSATRTPDGWILDGAERLVVNGDTADMVLVPARSDGDVSLFLVDTAVGRVVRDRVETLDQTRSLAHIAFEGTPASLVGREGAAATTYRAAFDRACVALAAETIGVADAALDMTVDYLKTRQQFGRPIGSFQALKHRCADLVLEIELARCAVDYAARAIDAAADDVATASAIAMAQAATAATRTTGECIQMHGGIGFTWEHDAHLFFKRARGNAALLGLVADHRERLLSTVLG